MGSISKRNEVVPVSGGTNAKRVVCGIIVMFGCRYTRRMWTLRGTTGTQSQDIQEDRTGWSVWWRRYVSHHITH